MKDDIADDFEWPLKVVLGTVNCIMYEVNYDGRTSCVRNYFYCRIRPEWLLYDAEHSLLAIATFLVIVAYILNGMTP